MKPEAKTAVEIVKESWGEEAPAWVQTLAEACDKLKSQAAAARRLGRSAGLVNGVLRNKYTGNLERVKDRVETAFKDEVACPVLGTINGGTCMTWQTKPYCGANHQLVRMYRACARCPNNKSRKGG